MNASHQSFAAAAPAFDPHLASAWAISQQEVADAIRFAKQYLRVIAERDEMLTPTIRVHSPAYVAQCVKKLPWLLSLYLEHVRRISETEAEMTARGMAFAKSSDAWGE